MSNDRPRLLRQGDVLLIPCEAREDELWSPQPREDGGIVLARGERSGHAHRIRDRGATIHRRFPEDDAWLRVDVPVRLEHEEHRALAVPAGDYIVRIQRQDVGRGGARARD